MILKSKHIKRIVMAKGNMTLRIEPELKVQVAVYRGGNYDF